MNKEELFGYALFVSALILLSMTLPVSDIVLAAYYQSRTNYCGYYTGSSSSCTSNPTTYCSPGYYYPTQSCSSSPAFTVCQTADTTHYCLVCGNCNGTTDTCNIATCGTTYGCAGGSVCNGQGTGAGNCVALGGTGATCYCPTMCTSGVCNASSKCADKYASSTNLCGYYNGTSSSCTGSVNNWCAAGTYYPSQGCSATPTNKACIAVTPSASCAVCGNCSTGNSDTCSAAACGTTNNYGCSNICDGQATGASHCNAIGGLGTTCYCAAQCQSGLYCIGNVCTLLNYSSNSTNSTFAGTSIRHNLYWQETGGGASGYIFRFCNGTWDGSNCLTATTGWLYGWLYRKEHNITGSTGGAQTNYPVRFTVYNTTGTDSGENVYLGSKARSDFGDVRFTNSTGSLLNYWIENTSTNYATFWVSVDSIPASPNNATIYIYYGKSDATTTSNGTSTFLAFLDKNTISLWTRYNVTGTYSNGAGSNGYWMYASSGTGGANEYWYSNAQWSNENFCVEWNAPYSQDNIRGDNFMQAGFYNGTDCYGWSEYGAEKAGGVGSYGDASGVWWHGSHTQSGYTSDWASGTMVFGQIKKLGGTAYFHLDHSTAPVVDHSDSTAANTGPYRAWAGVSSSYWTGAVWVNVTWAWIRARECISPEPSHGGWGSEVSDTWIADSWVQFTSGMCSSPYTACWSNVTKTVNSSVGATIAWCVLANDTSNNWNTTSCTTPFTYTTTAPPVVASISTDNTSYTACGTVFYKVKLYDQNSRLLNSYFTLNVLNPSLSTVSTVGSAYPNNGTGIFTGNYTLNATSPLGTWLLKVLESGGATSGKNFFVATTCGDKICADGENCTNCASDCGACYCGDSLCTSGENCQNCASDCTCYCGDGVCTAEEDCHNCVADCGCLPPGGCCNCALHFYMCVTNCPQGCPY